MKSDNMIARILFIIGVLEIIAGIILGFVLGNIEVSGYYSSYNTISWPIFLLWVIGGTISGMLFIGFSEVINLLSRLADISLKTKFEIETFKYEVEDDKNED